MDTMPDFNYECRTPSRNVDAKSIVRTIYGDVPMPPDVKLGLIPYQLTVPDYAEDKYLRESNSSDPVETVHAYSIALGYRNPTEAQEVASIILPCFMRSVAYTIDNLAGDKCGAFEELQGQTRSVINAFIGPNGAPLYSCGLNANMEHWAVGFFINIRTKPYFGSCGPGDIIMELIVALGHEAIQKICDYHGQLKLKDRGVDIFSNPATTKFN